MGFESAISGLLALAAADPMEAVSRARRMLEQNPAPAERVALLRTLGTALELRGDMSRSLAAFDEAVALAERLGDRSSEVAGTISLAGVLARLGRPDDAVAALDALGDPGTLTGRLRFQRGTILADVEPHRAVEDFDVAEQHLTSEDDPALLARLYKNRGKVHLRLADTARASRDLERARRLFAEVGDALERGVTEHNLGLTAIAAGSPAEALRWFDRSEPTIVDLAGSHVDPGRAEALLAAGLYEEAHREASRLADRLRAAGWDRPLAEMMLLAAEAALLAGQRDDALELAAKCRTLFFTQGRPAWEARAILVEQSALEAIGAVELDEIHDVVDELAAAGLRVSAARAEAIAARSAARTGRVNDAETHLEDARRLVDDPPLDLEIDLRSAEVEVRIANGDTAGAARAAAAGLRSVTSRRPAVTATDARIGLERHAAHLADRGLELAIESGNAKRVWTWMEHHRSAALGFRRVRSRDDPELAGLLAELRAITTDIQHADPERDSELAARQRRIEKEIEARGRATDSPVSVTTTALVDEAFDRLGDTALLEVTTVKSDLWVVLAHRGRATLHRLGDRVEWNDAALSLGSTLRRALYAGHDEVRLEAFKSQAEGFAGALGAVLPDLDCPVVVVPSRALTAVPWSTVLRGAGPVTVSPSTALWLAAGASEAGCGSVTALAGPDLEHAADEVSRVGQIHDVEVSASGTVANATALLGAHDTVHVAGPGRFRAGQPLFNSLTFEDGDLFIHDIEALATPPRNLVLSVRETGFTQRSGREMLETASVLLASGVRSIVASPWPLPDAATVTSAMARFHRGLAAGHGASTALHEASRVGPEQIVLDALCCFGA